MYKILIALFVLLILIGGGVGLYFLWRPKKTRPMKTCDWEDRECNYAQSCINQACIDKDGKVLQTQCLKVQRCQTPPVCEDWQDIGCDTANQCMRQECITDESERQCIDSAKCQKTPIAAKCPANTVLKGDYCYSVCTNGTSDMADEPNGGEYCKMNINKMPCPVDTVSVGPVRQGVFCYKRKYDPKTQQCIPEWINAGCDPKTHEKTQINSCTGEEKPIAGTSKECCPVWKSAGCDYEKYCTKLTDECGTVPDKCICGSFGGKKYSECCPKYNWDYTSGILKNKGMNEYVSFLVAGGYDTILSFSKQDPQIIFQPKSTGYLYMAIPYDIGGGKITTVHSYLTLGDQITPCTGRGVSCGSFTPKVKIAYSLQMTQQQKSVWAYNRLTGELVDNISDPKVKLSVIAMADQAGRNPQLVVAAVPYTNPKKPYDIWLYEQKK